MVGSGGDGGKGCEVTDIEYDERLHGLHKAISRNVKHSCEMEDRWAGRSVNVVLATVTTNVLAAIIATSTGCSSFSIVGLLAAVVAAPVLMYTSERTTMHGEAKSDWSALRQSVSEATTEPRDDAHLEFMTAAMLVLTERYPKECA